MEKYQKRMIEEHSELFIRIQKLHNWVYSDKSNADNKVEFANKCIQLAAMKKYEEALRARFENAGIVFENGEYFERVATITPVICDDNTGSDSNADAENNK
ncbi:MAG: crAss001_48 related protein [Clostridia bacterium]